MWILLCFLKVIYFEDNFSHIVHLNLFYSFDCCLIWVTLWFFNVVDRLKALLQEEQIWGFTVLWVSRWLLKLLEPVNVGAGKRSFAWVSCLMFLQVIGLGKEFVAQYTGKGLLPTVILLMSFEVFKLLEILNTLHTIKRCLSSVNLFVFLQVYWLGKTLVTMFAERDTGDRSAVDQPI